VTPFLDVPVRTYKERAEAPLTSSLLMRDFELGHDPFKTHIQVK
jgi:hypothetical protein